LLALAAAVFFFHHSIAIFVDSIDACVW
jgi:hypothetical protein